MMDKRFKDWRRFLTEVHRDWDPEDSSNLKPKPGDPDWKDEQKQPVNADWADLAMAATKMPLNHKRDTVGRSDPDILQHVLDRGGMNSTQNHNFKILAKTERLREIMVEKSSIAAASRKIGTLTQQIGLMVRENKIFNEVKIKKYLGGGYFGAVFELTNGHVLKISYGSWDAEQAMVDYSGTADAKKHEKSVDDLFNTKSAHKSTLMIYDYGTITFSNTPEDLYYVEMPKLITMDELFYGKSYDANDEILNIKDALVRKMYPPGMVDATEHDETDAFQRSLQRSLLSMEEQTLERVLGNLKILNMKQAMSLIRELIKILKSTDVYNYTDAKRLVKDVRYMNIGALSQDPNTLVLFDY